MSRPLITIAGVQREMNEEEFAQYEIDQEYDIIKQSKVESVRLAAETKLAALGLTKEELQIILEN
jgi:hypothetical protein